jgi:hypothetical protein
VEEIVAKPNVHVLADSHDNINDGDNYSNKNLLDFQSARAIYRPNGHRLSAKIAPRFWLVVSRVERNRPHGR